MKSVSKALHKWAIAFNVAAIFLLVIFVLGFCINSAWTESILNGAIILFVISPVFRGLSVLVQNAEEQIYDRRMVKFDKE